MRRRAAEPSQGSFADLARAVRTVPEEHVPLRMRRAIDGAAVESELAAYSDPEVGRPSCPPAVLLRMLVLEHYADLSAREVHEQVGYTLLFCKTGAPRASPPYVEPGLLATDACWTWLRKPIGSRTRLKTSRAPPVPVTVRSP